MVRILHSTFLIPKHSCKPFFFKCVHMYQSMPNIFIIFFIILGLKKYKCTVCDDWFTTAHSFRLHLESKHGYEIKRYTCHICSRNYSNNRSLQTHMNLHSKLKLYKCRLCPKTFPSKSGLKYHHTVHKESREFKCAICPSKFRVKGKLSEHIKLVHEKKGFHKCSVCQKTFSQKGNLLTHTRRHTGQQPCKCPHCPYLADCKRDLDRHVKFHFADGRYKCSECSASFDTRMHIRRHVRIIHRKDPGPLVYKCSRCPREYNVESSWRRHDLTHDQKRNFQCDKCVAKFYTKPHMKRHMTSHENGVGEFICITCNADFNTRQLLSQHNKKWHGLDTTLQSQGSKCPNCVAYFKAKIHMLKHKKLHQTSSDEFFCRPCSAKFSTGYSLTVHNNMWHSKKERNKQNKRQGQIKHVKCVLCAAKFHSISQLKRHLAVHWNATGKFVCTICYADFHTRALLSKHNKIMHGLDICLRTQDSKCPHCVAHFPGKYKMIRHQKVHSTTSDEFFCQPCYARFSSRNALILHNKKWHDKNKTHRKAISQTTSSTIGQGAFSARERENANGDGGQEKKEIIAYDPRRFFANIFIE